MSTSTKKPIGDQALKEAFSKVTAKYGQAIAQNVERIYRLETAHFTAPYFLATYTPGMVATKKIYPFGWGNLKTFWLTNESPTGYWSGKTLNYLVFPSLEGAMMSLAEVLKQRNNDAGTWYALDEKMQKEYEAKLKTVKVRYVV